MGLFKSDSDKDVSCPHHSLNQDAQDTIVGGLSFYHLSMIISGACSATAIIIMLVFKQLHATHLSNPSEQVKIMRIGNLVTMYSLISFLCLSFPKAAVYIDPWLHLVEGLALGSFFLLLCDYVSPLHDQREAYFATKKLGGVKWFRTRWFLIFQMPFVSLLVSIATDITAAAGVYCEFSSKPRFAKFWLSIIQSISLVASVLSILQFYQVLKVDLAHHRPLLKLMAFKAIVGLTFLQGIIFWILTDTNTLKESNTLTYADLHIGMPNLLICIEMVPLALFFTWAYPWSVYTDRDGRGNFVQVNQPSQPSQPSKSYQGGPFGIYAWLAMINPSETLRATMFAFTEGRKAQRATGRADDTDEERLYDNSYRMRPQGQPAAYASYGN